MPQGSGVRGGTDIRHIYVDKHRVSTKIMPAFFISPNFVKHLCLVFEDIVFVIGGLALGVCQAGGALSGGGIAGVRFGEVVIPSPWSALAPEIRPQPGIRCVRYMRLRNSGLIINFALRINFGLGSGPAGTAGG